MDTSNFILVHRRYKNVYKAGDVIIGVGEAINSYLIKFPVKKTFQKRNPYVNREL